jgi:acetyl-CoA acetyltransferase
MHEFNVTNEDLAEVAVFTRYHATLNPDSVMGRKGEITVEDVLASRYVCEPLHLLDCSIDNDGGYAVVIASADRARDCRTKPVWILGGAEAYYTDFYATINDPWFPNQGKAVRKATDRAFGLAGISRDEIDVAGLYDCFTITTVRDLEEMGFCKLGRGPTTSGKATCAWAGRCRRTPTAACCPTATAATRPACTRSRSSASCAASAAPARSPMPGSGCPCSRAGPCTAWPAR